MSRYEYVRFGECETNAAFIVRWGDGSVRRLSHDQAEVKRFYVQIGWWKLKAIVHDVLYVSDLTIAKSRSVRESVSDTIFFYVLILRELLQHVNDVLICRERDIKINSSTVYINLYRLQYKV